jgi:hypothetical protein
MGEQGTDVYIYHNGYVQTGGIWKGVRWYCEGEKSGPWCIGRARGRMDLNPAPAPSQFLAYMCMKQEGEWKCGCRDRACQKGYWQLQGVEVKE